MKLLIRILFVVIIILSAAVLIIFPDIFSLLGQKIYWLELLLLLFLIWGYNFSSTLILIIALALTTLGALLSIFLLTFLSEITLGISLVFWLVGIAKTLVVYYKSNK